MDQADHGRRRPKRLLEVKRIRNNELLDIHNVGDEKKVDQKKASKDPVHFALRKWYWAVLHGYL